MSHLGIWKFSFLSVSYRRIFILTLAFLGGFLVSSHAQQVSIQKVEIQASGDVIIHYDLQDDNIDRKYSLYLYTSMDNYIQPLEKATDENGIAILSDQEVEDIVKRSYQYIAMYNVNQKMALEEKGMTYKHMRK